MFPCGATPPVPKAPRPPTNPRHRDEKRTFPLPRGTAMAPLDPPRGGGAMTHFRLRRPRGASRCPSASSGFKSGESVGSWFAWRAREGALAERVRGGRSRLSSCGLWRTPADRSREVFREEPRAPAQPQVVEAPAPGKAFFSPPRGFHKETASFSFQSCFSVLCLSVGPELPSLFFPLVLRRKSELRTNR